jgi:hypothetical protein
MYGYNNIVCINKYSTSHQLSNVLQCHQANHYELMVYDFHQAFIHETDTSNDDNTGDSNNELEIAPIILDTNEQNTILINIAKTTNSVKLPPGNIRSVRCKSFTSFVSVVEYIVSKHQTETSMMSLVDRGSNVCLECDDICVKDPTIIFDAYQNEITIDSYNRFINEPNIISSRSPDFAKHCILFVCLPSEIIEKLFRHATPYALLPSGTLFKKVFKSSRSALIFFTKISLLLLILSTLIHPLSVVEKQ